MDEADYVDPAVLRDEVARRRMSFRQGLHTIRFAVGLAWSASRWRVSLMVSVQLLGAGLSVAQVFVGKAVLDSILKHRTDATSVTEAIPGVIVLGLLLAISTLSAAQQGQQQRYLGELVQRRTWERVLDVTQSIPLASFEDPAFYNRLKRVETNAVTQPLLMTQGLTNLIGGLVGAVFVAAALATLHPLLLVVVPVAGVPLILLARRTSRLEFAFAREATIDFRLREYYRSLLTDRAPAKEIRAFSSAGHVREKYDQACNAFLTRLLRLTRQRIAVEALGALATAAMTAGMLALLLWLVSDGRLSLAAAGAGLVAIRLLGARLQATFAGVGTVWQASVFVDDLVDFLADVVPLTEAASPPTGPSSTFRSIQVSDLSFTYQGTIAPALNAIDFRLSRGEVVALVGENGSGKTTLAKIIAGLYEATSGTVEWCSDRGPESDPRWIAEQCAVIFQDFVHYEMSVRDNIVMSRPAAGSDDDRLQGAARRAGVDGVVTRLTDGYDSMLGRLFPGGRDLSGGQWQRIALARLFFRDSPLVILDEPTSALDARAEAALFATVRELYSDRAVLVISHRFATVRDADRICVLDRGRIVEQGPHDDLMRQGGLYADLYDLQARAFTEAGPGSEL